MYLCFEKFKRLKLFMINKLSEISKKFDFYPMSHILIASQCLLSFCLNIFTIKFFFRSISSLRCNFS